MGESACPVLFRMTKFVYLLWPFYTPKGSIYTNLADELTLPFEATYGFYAHN